MGLCSSRTAVALAPAHLLTVEVASQADSGGREKATPVPDMEARPEGGGGGSSGGAGSPNPLQTKGYLELSGKVDGDPPQVSEAEEVEQEETGRGELEDLLRFSDGGSLRSEFLA